MLSEILFETEKVYINYNHDFTLAHDFSMNETLAELSFMIDKTKENEIAFLPLKLELIPQNEQVITDYSVTCEGSIFSSRISINEAIAQILTRSSSLLTSDLSQLSALNYKIGLIQGYV